MTIYYSPTTKGFYDTDFGYPSLPEDIIEITSEQHSQLLHAVNMERKEIYVENGVINTRPIVNVPTWNEIRALRNRFLENSDYTQMPDWPGDKPTWATYRQELRNIPQVFSSPSDVVWPTPPGE